MFYGNAPQYLLDLVPSSVAENSSYALRNSNNLQGIHCRTSIYEHSFIPSVIRDWNNIPLQQRQNPSISNFKRFLTVDIKKNSILLLCR